MGFGATPGAEAGVGELVRRVREVLDCWCAAGWDVTPRCLPAKDEGRGAERFTTAWHTRRRSNKVSERNMNIRRATRVFVGR